MSMFFFQSRSRHTRCSRDWSSDVCSSDLPELDPLYRWEISQPGNVLRVFERGGHRKAEMGNPNRQEDPGKPNDKLSDRGFGTGLRTDPVFLGLQKTDRKSTRLNSSHGYISYAVFCLKKKKKNKRQIAQTKI